jgi:hypothetical protein
MCLCQFLWLSEFCVLVHFILFLPLWLSNLFFLRCCIPLLFSRLFASCIRLSFDYQQLHQGQGTRTTFYFVRTQQRRSHQTTNITRNPFSSPFLSHNISRTCLAVVDVAVDAAVDVAADAVEECLVSRHSDLMLSKQPSRTLARHTL